MSKVIADITMSLDGFVTGPDTDDEPGLGGAPELHAWVMEQDATDEERASESGEADEHQPGPDAQPGKPVTHGPAAWVVGHGAIR